MVKKGKRPINLTINFKEDLNDSKYINPLIIANNHTWTFYFGDMSKKNFVWG